MLPFLGDTKNTTKLINPKVQCRHFKLKHCNGNETHEKSSLNIVMGFPEL